MKNIFLIVFLALMSGVGYAQSVTLIPPPQFVSYLQNGTPNAFGCVFTYNSGTSTPLGTFTDYTGSISNTNPAVLSAGGTAPIWFTLGTLYRVVVKTSGGTNCAGGSTLYTVDGINSTLLNTANVWQASQTFEATTYFTLADLQLVFGVSGSQTTLDFPPTSGNFILHAPPIVGNDTLLNKNSPAITTPIINGCQITNGPGTYICIQNNSSTATILNGLAVTSGATVTQAPVNSSGAIIGVVTAGAGITGSATVQQSGVAACLFDGATTAGDYVQASTVAGYECHDSGSSTNVVGSNLGIVLSTNSGGGAYSVLLSLGSPYRVLSSNSVAVNSNLNTTSQQPLMTYAFAAGSLNAVGKTFRVTTYADVAPGSAINSTLSFGAGTTAGLGLPQQLAQQNSSADTWAASTSLTCLVQVAGVSGDILCTTISQVGGNSGNTAAVSPGAPTVAIAPANLTAPLYIGLSCAFASASISNSCSQAYMLVEQLN
jgi:hypothetical protein